MILVLPEFKLERNPNLRLYIAGFPGKALTKVGISTNIKRRLYKFKGARHLVSIKVPYPYDLEQELLLQLKNYNYSGEWLDMLDVDVADYAVSLLGNKRFAPYTLYWS